ncbi:MAG TPA: hypothetical protein DCE76_04755 [Anaerolineaceae bacterium]|nr:hypothetical protein [Anaerolineaceae bacterium]
MGEIPTSILGQALDILLVLEAVEWKWDINTILSQPDDLLRAVLRLKSVGEKLRREQSDAE